MPRRPHVHLHTTLLARLDAADAALAGLFDTAGGTLASLDADPAGQHGRPWVRLWGRSTSPTAEGGADRRGSPRPVQGPGELADVGACLRAVVNNEHVPGCPGPARLPAEVPRSDLGEHRLLRRAGLGLADRPVAAGQRPWFTFVRYRRAVPHTRRPTPPAAGVQSASPATGCGSGRPTNVPGRRGRGRSRRSRRRRATVGSGSGAARG